MDQNQERRRGHFHRGRRGAERRTPPPAQEQPGRDRVDVEHIMRDIRARIAQRHGIDLSNQQIEELAARRLESILDPRTIKPALLDQMRRAAGAQTERPDHRAAAEPPYSFDDTAIYDSRRGVLRLIRRLLNPLLRLFFNPNPVVRALNIQAKLNVEAAERDADRERRQAEWNALHYEIVRRLVTEVSRVSIDLQTLSARIESLSAKVDFNERRVRGIEGVVHQSRPAPRPAEVTAAAGAPPSEAMPAEPATEGSQPGEGSRRRRRRRRGRRGSGVPEAAPPVRSVESGPLPAAPDADARPSDVGSVEDSIPPPVTTEGGTPVHAQERQEPAAANPAPPPSTWEAPAPPSERAARPDSDSTEQ